MTLKERYFGTDGIRGRVGEEPITPEVMLRLGWAIGNVLANGSHGKVLIGKDTRISGYLLESALEAGLTAAGLDAYLLGPLPTPAIAYLACKEKALAGIVISASHNAYTDNGIKLFCQHGFKLPDTVELAIEKQLQQPLKMVTPAKLGKAYRLHEAVDRYVEFCLSTISSKMRLDDLRIVIDCANGATYRAAPKAFTQLGANLVNLSVNPNGLNINLNCGSTKPAELQQTVRALNADLGIAFDGDGDRVIMVDESGEVVDGDELLFILAEHKKRQKKLVGGVVGTQMSNFGLEKALENIGMPFCRTKVGDRYVLKMLKEKGWLLGGETSGHIVNLDMSTTGDGLIAALQILEAIVTTGQPLSKLKQGMKKFPQTIINVAMPKAVDPYQVPQLQKVINDAEIELAKTGRVLLRPSGTEPVIRVMVEGIDNSQVMRVATNLAQEVESYLTRLAG